MKCRNCGQEISVWGKFCPWCRTPMEESAYVNVSSWINMAFGIILGVFAGAFIGWNLGDAEEAKIAYAFLGALGGFFVGGVIGNIKGWNSADKEMSNRYGSVGGTDCPHCGYKTSFNVAQNSDKYCGNCGKRFGG